MHSIVAIQDEHCETKADEVKEDLEEKKEELTEEASKGKEAKKKRSCK